VIAALDVYALALEDPEEPLIARGPKGRSQPIGVTRWLEPVNEVDERALARARGPVLDVGCGPGRHVRALARCGVLAVGVDVSRTAVTLARSRGALALRLSVFDDVPGAGSWRTALLLDGNIGIGASPATLLRRIASLLAPGGEVLVELAPPGGGVAIRRIRLEHGSARSAWFQWAIVAVDAIDEPARRAGLEVVERWLDGERFFALLRLA
jgi:SAM-dependent methyltransferase